MCHAVIGPNAVGILLGKGWQSMAGHTPAARLLLSVTATTGNVTYVTSNDDWLGSRGGPIRGNDIYQGEVYDARLELRGWSESYYNDSAWRSVEEMEEFKDYQVTWQPRRPPPPCLRAACMLTIYDRSLN